MIKIRGGLTAPKGFLANGVKAGIKESGKKDLALVYSETPAHAAGAFTTNRFQASPVKISKIHLRNNTHRAVIVNSGNANCANGAAGDRKAVMMADFISRTMGLEREEVLIASTGIIGRPLPIEKIEYAIPVLISDLSRAGGRLFAESIMTTDTVKKECAVKVRIGGVTVTIGGACKGVGMIYPEMRPAPHATMLAFITTDAAISKRMLGKALGAAIDDSFNMASVDGDMSTNDSCFILANGMAGNRPIDTHNKAYEIFEEALKSLCGDLARMLVRDGEGATKFVEIEVNGARNCRDARAIARKISTSSLLKCCIYGEDPNWGRVVAAAGASGVDFDPGKVDVYLGGLKALSNGSISGAYNKELARKFFKKKYVKIKVDLKSGKGRAIAWTCDFSKEYVAINSEYST